jgi:hypothetical protein
MPKVKVAEKAQNDKKPVIVFFKFGTKSDSDGCNGDGSQLESMFSSFMSKYSGKNMKEKNEETANPSWCDDPTGDSIPPTDTPTQEQLSESSNHAHAKSATEEGSVANLTNSKEGASSKALPGMAESSSNQETDGGDDPQKESFFGKIAKTNDKEKNGDDEVHDESTFSMKFISLF